MKVLVTYYTQTGNTQKIAEAIYDEAKAGGHAVNLKRVQELTPADLNGYDLVFLGSPCHSTDLAAPVKALLEAMPPSSSFRLAGFVTHATTLPEGGETQHELYEAWAGRCPQTFERACRERGIGWCGYFSCQGAPSAPIEAFIHQQIVTEAEMWEGYIADVRKHPTEEDRERARAFARSCLEGAGS